MDSGHKMKPGSLCAHCSPSLLYIIYHLRGGVSCIFLWKPQIRCACVTSVVKWPLNLQDPSVVDQLFIVAFDCLVQLIWAFKCEINR